MLTQEEREFFTEEEARLDEAKRKWEDKITVVPQTRRQYHGSFTVRLKYTGRPSNYALVCAANGWQHHFGGYVEHRFTHGGTKFATMKVYTD